MAADKTPVLPPEKKTSIPALNILPNGSELKGVMIPRYDENHALTGVLKATKMKLVREGEIAGTVVSLEMFNPDQTSRVKIDLATALYEEAKELVSSRDPVQIRSDRMNATASGIQYYFVAKDPDGALNPLAGKGFLLGKVTTTIFPAPAAATSMNVPARPLRSAALLGMALVSNTLPAKARPQITSADTAAVHADAASREETVVRAAAESQVALKKDLADAEAASQAAATFLVQASLPAPDPAPAPPDAKPLEVTPDPANTVIHCEGGMYFDPEAGVLVYLKNVTVTDPRFDLSGTINELKIFFGKKPEKPGKPATDKTDKSKEGFGGFGSNLGDVERIVATGAIVLDQKPAEADKIPIKASGAIFSYNIKADQIIISGGYPWVVQGPNKLRAKQPNLSLKIAPKAGTFVTDGGKWDTFLNLEQKK